MRTSWYNDTVAFRPISKNGTLNLNGPVLWPSTDNQSFFASGGGRSFFAQVIDPPDVASWRFTTDENGGETWVIFKPVDDSIFYTLTQPDGASGATVHDTGCIFGGQESALTGNNISIVQRANTGHGVVQHHIRSVEQCHNTGLYRRNECTSRHPSQYTRIWIKRFTCSGVGPF